MAEYKIAILGTDSTEYLTFDNSSITVGSIQMSTAVDIIGDELSADVFTAEVDWSDEEYLLFSPSDYDGIITSDGYWFGCESVGGDIMAVEYGYPLVLYADGENIAKFFVRSIVRTGKTKYKINAMSAVGFLDSERHFGGVYNGTTVGDLIADIIGGTFSYDQLTTAYRYQKVVGWLPIDSRRANLHRVMFAFGLSLKKSASGNMVFVHLTGNNPKSIPDSRIFIGGTVNYEEQVTAVEVVEHLFYRDSKAEQEEIFSNVGTAEADNLLVEFDEPHYSLTTDGTLTIVSGQSGDNYAIVSGIGTLYGKRYGHDKTTIRKSISGSTAITPNVVTSSDDCLINSMNSATVIDQLAAYYGSRKTVNADIIFNLEKAGDPISFNDAFGDPSTGIISRMDLIASSFVRSSCDIVTGYNPPEKYGNVYNNKLVISSSQSRQLPSVSKIRVVLIQGGTGGQGGYDGESGFGNETNYGGDLTRIDNRPDDIGLVYSGGNQGIAHGGNPGDAGVGGKAAVFDLTITPRMMCSVIVGQGGAGGAANGGLGAAGEETTITIGSVTYSSSTGSNYRPYYDPFSTDVYGADGEAGHAGGDGGQTDITSLYAANGASGFPGSNVGAYTGGEGGSGYLGRWGTLPTTEEEGYLRRASGGGGGGAAYGEVGADGLPARYESGLSAILYGGDGGAGGDASPPSKPTYGCGGAGGNGGGGGGNGGGCVSYSPLSSEAVLPGSGGRGGYGSTGGSGGNGVCIIYY